MKISRLFPRHKPKIFISYRRQDTAGHAGRLHADLSRHFGWKQIFIDIDSIRGGDDFVEQIKKSVASCDVLVAVIGNQWLTISDGAARKLDNPQDYVRLEIADALEQKIPVIPILVQGARVPDKQDLPAELEPLARRNATEISDTRWVHDVTRLIDRIEEVSPKQPITWQKPLVILIIGLLIGFVILLSLRWPVVFPGSNVNSVNNQTDSTVEIKPKSDNLNSNDTKDGITVTADATDPGRKRVRPIQPGLSYSHEKITGGNVCCVVRDKDGATYLLSSNDVFVSREAKVGDSILQPGTYYGGEENDKVAILTKWLAATQTSSVTVVGAIARIESGIKWSPDIFGVGPITGIQESVIEGDELLVVGYQGKLNRIVTKAKANLIINWTDPKSVIESIIVIDKYDKEDRTYPTVEHLGGYSGSPVLTKDGKLVGMVVDFASILRINGATGTEMHVVPIQRILARLEVELVLSQANP